MSLEDLVYRFTIQHFRNAIESGIKELLEHKHLYQNLDIDLDFDQVLAGVLGQTQKIAKESQSIVSVFGFDADKTTRASEVAFRAGAELPWQIQNPHEMHAGYLVHAGSSDTPPFSVSLTPPTAKMFCPVCKDVEPYNFEKGKDFLADIGGAEPGAPHSQTQVFILAYRCQSCKSLPEVFLVRRQGMKLTLSGRTPMEQFKVPKLFPKARRRFISDAAIAFNSGQVLAANFLLRTFIEQYVRAETDNLQSQDLDDIFAKYGVKLPDDFKQRFPSLKSIYETLSVDIHSATGSQATFLKARKDIETHFDAKRIFESLGK